MIAAIIYPHQLYDEHPAIQATDLCVLVEEPLFFTQYKFHAHKLVLHRASMQHYAVQLRKRGHRVAYVTSAELARTTDIGSHLARLGVERVRVVNPCDDWLHRRLTQSLKASRIAFDLVDDPHFMTTPEEFDQFAANRKSLFFTDFYVSRRKHWGILLEKDGRPVGGKWTYDVDNRRKLPKEITVPVPYRPQPDPIVREAIRSVRSDFRSAPGIDEPFHFPVTREQAQRTLTDFLDYRFANFGPYEDAIDQERPFLFHSLLTPALNIGLVSPHEVIHAALDRADVVPLQSLEGFVRQIIGWREYMRGVYLRLGLQQRTSNFWQHTRALPDSFYSGTTGIEPVDIVIRRVLKHAYCHHIERLMILGNFMLLCEIRPHDVYRWFMELFIDSYDWVMVPNVYGMSQYADGGIITTKPYISGSSYVLRMSNFKKGPWCATWDALYWRFIHKHREVLSNNPRMALMVKQCDRLGSRLNDHLRTAETFLTDMT